jgi:predicted small metal-binding protein
VVNSVRRRQGRFCKGNVWRTCKGAVCFPLQIITVAGRHIGDRMVVRAVVMDRRRLAIAQKAVCLPRPRAAVRSRKQWHVKAAKSGDVQEELAFHVREQHELTRYIRRLFPATIKTSITNIYPARGSNARSRARSKTKSKTMARAAGQINMTYTQLPLSIRKPAIRQRV